MYVCIKDWIFLTSYSFKIKMKIASMISRRKQKTFEFTSGVFRLYETYISFTFCWKHRAVVPLLTRCFYITTKASKSVRFGVIATLVMKNIIVLSMKSHSLIEIIRSHRNIPPPFSEQTRFFCTGYMSKEKIRLMARSYFTMLYQYWKYLVLKQTRIWLLSLDVKGPKKESALKH